MKKYILEVYSFKCDRITCQIIFDLYMALGFDNTGHTALWLHTYLFTLKTSDFPRAEKETAT